MDEYTFLVLAKLKADRLKLERDAAPPTPSARGIRTSCAAQRATLPQSDRLEARNTGPEYFGGTPPVRMFLAWR